MSEFEDRSWIGGCLKLETRAKREEGGGVWDLFRYRLWMGVFIATCYYGILRTDRCRPLQIQMN